MCAIPGKPRATWATTFTMRPRFCGRKKPFAAACVTVQVPRRLLRTTASKPLGLMCCAGDGNWPPALLTSTSTGPRASPTASKNAVTESGSRMSAVPWKTVTPSASSDSAAAASGSGRRPQIATLAPSAPISRAMASPMPVPPPVMTATSPSNSPGANSGSSTPPL